MSLDCEAAGFNGSSRTASCWVVVAPCVETPASAVEIRYVFDGPQHHVLVVAPTPSVYV